MDHEAFCASAYQAFHLRPASPRRATLGDGGVWDPRGSRDGPGTDAQDGRNGEDDVGDDDFIGQVQHRARRSSHGAAEPATRATMETLAQRLVGGATPDLAVHPSVAPAQNA